MGRSRHTEAQIIAALKQVEAGRTVDGPVSLPDFHVFNCQDFG